MIEELVPPYTQKQTTTPWSQDQDLIAAGRTGWWQTSTESAPRILIPSAEFNLFRICFCSPSKSAPGACDFFFMKWAYLIAVSCEHKGSYSS